MKTLFSSFHNPSFWTITEYTERAIMKLGHELIPFDDREFIIPGRVRQRMGSLHKWDLKRLNRKLVSLASLVKPDLCFVAGGNRILPETLKTLKSQGIKTVLWTVDAPRNFRPILEAASFYDHIFCGGTEAQELLARAGFQKTLWLPFACDPDIHKPVETSSEEKAEWGSDVVFIGSFYPHRAQILEKITDFDLKVWGPGWKKLPRGSALKKRTTDKKLKPGEWVKILSSSKINLAIHFQDGTTPCYQASPRVYEALACRSFLLVDEQRDVKSLFQDGKHLALFKDSEDLREKIDYYLSHADKRKEMAAQGYEEVIHKHTYMNRMEKMFSIIEADK